MIDQEISDINQTDLNTELAKERTHTAYENNLMAWIRTALSLIGFGIGIFEVAQKTGGNSVFRSSRLVGLLLVLLAITAIILAIRENQSNHQKLLKGYLKYNRKNTLSIKVSYGLLFIGVLALINIIYKIITIGI